MMKKYWERNLRNWSLCREMPAACPDSFIHIISFRGHAVGMSLRKKQSFFQFFGFSLIYRFILKYSSSFLITWSWNLSCHSNCSNPLSLHHFFTSPLYWLINIEMESQTGFENWLKPYCDEFFRVMSSMQWRWFGMIINSSRMIFGRSTGSSCKNRLAMLPISDKPIIPFLTSPSRCSKSFTQVVIKYALEEE